jgi:hypothetical protein
VAAGAAGACVAAGAAGLAGAWVAAGAGAPQAEINKTISKIMTKVFRDIKAPAKLEYENISQRIERNNFLGIKNPPHMRRVYFLLLSFQTTYSSSEQVCFFHNS